MKRKGSQNRFGVEHPLRVTVGTAATFLVWFCIVGGMIGCAHSPSKNPEEILRERAEKVWQGKVTGDCVAVYNSMSAQYRKMVSKDAFGAGCLKNRIESYEITNIVMSDDQTHAVVTVKFDTFKMGYLFKGAQIKENWVKEGRRWVVDLRPMGKSAF